MDHDGEFHEQARSQDLKAESQDRATTMFSEDRDVSPSRFSHSGNPWFFATKVEGHLLLFLKQSLGGQPPVVEVKCTKIYGF